MEISTPASSSPSFRRMVGSQVVGLALAFLAASFIYIFSSDVFLFLGNLVNWLYSDTFDSTLTERFFEMSVFAVSFWICFLLPGVVLGVGQWLVLRRWIRRSSAGSWILHSGLAVIILAIPSLLLYKTIDLPDLYMIQGPDIPLEGAQRLAAVLLANSLFIGLAVGFLMGLLVGLFQSLWLQARKRTWWWISAVTWALLLAGFSYYIKFGVIQAFYQYHH